MSGDQSLGVSVAGRYRLDRLIGRGNLGNVYAAADLLRQRTVTLKLAHAVADSGQSSRSLAARFRRELELSAKLKHPAISLALDAGEFLESPFLVCEYVEGRSLVDWFEEGGRNFEALALLLETVLEALALAHSQKVVHRALKPGHILVDDRGQPRILDFGLSARLDDQLGGQRLPSDLAYLSPEQILGERGDGRSDLYALGAILYHLAAGEPPFVAQTPAQMLLSHLHQQPVPLANLPRSVPTWLDRLARRLLLKQPADRPGSAQDVLDLVRRRPSRGPSLPPTLAPLLGRERELGQLETLLEQTVQGRGACVWLWGEVGVGKNHLLQHLRRQAVSRGLEWIELDSGEGRSLQPLDWVRHPAFGFYPEAASLADWSEQRPRVCVLRGVEEADDAFWSLTADWASRLGDRPLLLILVAEEPPRKTFEPRLKLALKLEGLAREHCARLIEERIWSPPPPDAATWLYRVSAGNPLFLALLLEKLEGVYLVVDGPAARWLPPPSQHEGSLAVWLSRDLSDLGPAAHELLGLAGVVGPRFSPNLVKSLFLGDEAQLEQSLDQLVRMGWLQETQEGGVSGYRFTHRARWLAARALLDRRRQRRLATLVGAFLEFPQSGTPDWARAADYYELAQDSKAALRCLTQCLLLACEAEDWPLARAWMRRCQRPAAQAVDRIFPGPWYHFGWSGAGPASGPRHFLATLLAYQGRPEEALWYLQVSLEDDLEDDPPSWVENLLLRVTYQLRGWARLERPPLELTQEAREVARTHGFEQGEALASALALKISPGLSPEPGTPAGLDSL